LEDIFVVAELAIINLLIFKFLLVRYYGGNVENARVVFSARKTPGRPLKYEKKMGNAASLAKKYQLLSWGNFIYFSSKLDGFYSTRQKSCKASGFSKLKIRFSPIVFY